MVKLKEIFKRKKVSKCLLTTVLITFLILLIIQPNLFWMEICGPGSSGGERVLEIGEYKSSSGITGNSIKWSYNANNDTFLAIVIMNNSNQPEFRDTYINLYDTYNDSTLIFFATLIHPNFSYAFLSISNLSRLSGNWKVPYYDTWHMIFFNINNMTILNFITNVCYYITKLPNFRLYSIIWFILIIGSHISLLIDHLRDIEKDRRRKSFWFAILTSIIINFIIFILFTFIYMNYELSLTGTGPI